MKYWLVKFSPKRTPWAEIVKTGVFTIRGVRSPEARNNLKAMENGNLVLFYHSQYELRVIGLLEVIKPAFQDPTTTDPRWVSVTFKPVKPLIEPVTLVQSKADPALVDLPLIRQPRLAVMPLTSVQFQKILNQSDPSPEKGGTP
ncbi:MAG: EVE domain-containing protein [Pontiellaceae bacterium]|nr:EVE domain-containing protein [Pontiellaceae bacterium]